MDLMTAGVGIFNTISSSSATADAQGTKNDKSNASCLLALAPFAALDIGVGANGQTSGISPWNTDRNGPLAPIYIPPTAVIRDMAFVILTITATRANIRNLQC